MSNDMDLREMELKELKEVMGLNTNKIGCFCLHTTVFEEGDYSIGNYYLVKNFKEDDLGIAFHALAITNDFNKLQKLTDKQIPARLPEENMLQYFDRLQLSNKACWLYVRLSNIDSYIMRGRFEYNDNDEIVSDRSISAYHHALENNVTDANITPFPEKK